MPPRWNNLDVCKNGHKTPLSNMHVSTIRGRLYFRCKTCISEIKLKKERAAGILPRISIPAEIRFWKSVDKKSIDECWEWQAGIGSHGYGVFNGNYNKPILAHIYSYILAKGPVAPKMQVDHLCFNRKCVNPEHLEQVTNQENTIRMYKHKKENQRRTKCVLFP
jgi:hypothetical protein